MPRPIVAAHGTNWTYQQYRCRCDECRAAHAARNRAWLQRKAEREGTRRLTPLERLEKGVAETAGGCMEWTGLKNRRGYGVITVDGRSRPAHRFAWSVTNGPIPDGLQILHHCDNPPCCNPEHLYAGTHVDNMRDKRERGRSSYLIGEANGYSKLTEADVRAIRVLHVPRVITHADIASWFGVATGTISKVLQGKTWRHVA